jgi:hypothetical protein
LKQGSNWLTQEKEQLAKSWRKISQDAIHSNGQKFWQNVADDYNNLSSGVGGEVTSVMWRLLHFIPEFFSFYKLMGFFRWGHIQKATLKSLAVSLCDAKG